MMLLAKKKRYEGPMNQRSNLHSIIREVKEAKNELPKLVVKHLRREQNYVAMSSHNCQSEWFMLWWGMIVLLCVSRN